MKVLYTYMNNFCKKIEFIQKARENNEENTPEYKRKIFSKF